MRSVSIVASKRLETELSDIAGYSIGNNAHTPTFAMSQPEWQQSKQELKLPTDVHVMKVRLY
ncbi:hypothetical protein [Aliiroseovarius halocynthiae]|uniref:Uncharacterized protein n=1 Tax=Aliiroseovarius halocynthiae TaxID=985055 RepID=A0A545SS84_9RHOB|nr:hypothetical protein [Aliiroseovarius halocynthiae]TQV67834.1 hypothetical protein FIL88_08275 [Aliiroseovarius halocynthiae]